jgi:serine/threonine protein kinase
MRNRPQNMGVVFRNESDVTRFARPTQVAPWLAIDQKSSAVRVAARYRIVSLLGRGGTGEVYRADDLKLGQAVALKFLPTPLQRKPEYLERLLGEAKLARQVSHPNVCRVYDIGK